MPLRSRLTWVSSWERPPSAERWPGPVHAGLPPQGAAGFPSGKTFDAWDPGASSNPAPTQQTPRTLEWITRRENLVLCGPSGSGKTILPRSTRRASCGGSRDAGGVIQAPGPRRHDSLESHRRWCDAGWRCQSVGRPIQNGPSHAVYRLDFRSGYAHFGNVVELVLSVGVVEVPGGRACAI